MNSSMPTKVPTDKHERAARTIDMLFRKGFHGKYLPRLDKIDVTWREYDTKREVLVDFKERLDNTANAYWEFVYGADGK